VTSPCLRLAVSNRSSLSHHCPLRAKGPLLSKLLPCCAPGAVVTVRGCLLMKRLVSLATLLALLLRLAPATSAACVSKVGAKCMPGDAAKDCCAGLSCHPGVSRCYNEPRLLKQPCVPGGGHMDYSAVAQAAACAQHVCGWPHSRFEQAAQAGQGHVLCIDSRLDEQRRQSRAVRLMLCLVDAVHKIQALQLSCRQRLQLQHRPELSCRQRLQLQHRPELFGSAPPLLPLATQGIPALLPY
jgi:hypothetical protein